LQEKVGRQRAINEQALPSRHAAAITRGPHIKGQSHI
jgi:hypothetical protein